MPKTRHLTGSYVGEFFVAPEILVPWQRMIYLFFQMQRTVLRQPLGLGWFVETLKDSNLFKEFKAFLIGPRPRLSLGSKYRNIGSTCWDPELKLKLLHF